MGGYYRYGPPSDDSSGHLYMPHQQPQDGQSTSIGLTSSSPRELSQSEGGPSYPGGQYGQAPSGQQLPLSAEYNPAPAGHIAHAPSSHFVSSGSFDFGGGLHEGIGELDTAGLLPNLGSRPLEMTEMELESTPGSETFASPREYGGYPEAATRGPAGPAGKIQTLRLICMIHPLSVAAVPLAETPHVLKADLS